jgi:ADP-dependent glucokinase
MTKFKILFALLTLLIAFYYPSIKSAYDHYISLPYLNVSAASIALNSGFVNDAGIEREIIKSWKSLINLPARMTTANHEKKLKVLIGLNTNVDLILSGTDLFKAMNIDTKSRPQPHEHIASLNDFKESFMYYFKKGSAAERSFKTLGDFEAVLAASESLKNKEWFIGGNAGLMAQGISQRFADACEIILVGPVGPKLKDLLHPSVKVPSDCATESDEVHLILEYHAKESFEGSVSPQANRFIVSHDIYNSKMEMLSEFFNFTREFEPDIAILSGLHLLESQSFEFRNEKLEMVKNSLSNVKPDCIIHLELASFGDKSLMKMILDKNILPEINSLGLNEQELLFISHASENAPHSNYFTEINGQPDLTKVIDIMEWILNKFGADSTQDSSASKFTKNQTKSPKKNNICS